MGLTLNTGRQPNLSHKLPKNNKDTFRIDEDNVITVGKLELKL